MLALSRRYCLDEPSNPTCIRGVRLALGALIPFNGRDVLGAEPDQAAAVKVAREWLASHDPARRKRLSAKLAEYQGDFEPVIEKLSQRTFPAAKAGYDPGEHFAQRELLKKHPDDLLYFVVPKSYRPDRATGLIVFLHGGGATTTRRAPRATLSFPTADSPADTNRSGDMFAATGMITVGPSAPWDTKTSYRWCVAGADKYLADVIEECKCRFDIDPDRVFLLGHSMGGFGALSFRAAGDGPLCRGDRQFRIVDRSILAGDSRHSALHRAGGA